MTTFSAGSSVKGIYGTMRINFLTFATSWGGAEIHTVRLARLLAARGHRVAILQVGNNVYGSRPTETDAAVELIRLNWTPRHSFLELYRTLHSCRGDVGVLVKGIFTTGGIRSDLATWLCHQHFLTIEHNMADPLPQNRLRLWIRHARSSARAIFPKHIICVSEGVRQRLYRENRYPANKMLTIHPGVGAGLFRPAPEQRRDLLRSWGIPEGAVVYGAVGRLEPEKNFRAAIAGLAMARARGLDREAWLVLGGDGSERESLARASAALGVSDRVRFLGYQNRPWEVYPGFDYFVMPSTREGLPCSLLEAMACGCPGIAMNVGGVPEVISDPELGWLVPAGDEDRFHDAMLAAAHTSVEERARRARGVRSHVQAHFSDQPCFARLASIIEGGELVEVSATSRTARA